MTNWNVYTIIAKLSRNAAIAQPVERILGKDEVASSNLASSSKPLNLIEVQGFFLFSDPISDRILLPHFTEKEAVYESFIVAQTSRGVSNATINNYHKKHR